MNKCKILIVEDEEDMNELLRSFLKRRGFENVEGVDTGARALQHIKNDQPDVVFLDIVLGDDIDGMKVLEEGRTLSPDTKFIMMSAHKDVYDQKAKELGVYAFLGKPVQVDMIIRILEEIATNGR